MSHVEWSNHSWEHGHRITYFISDSDLIKAPVGAFERLGALEEEFRHQLCIILEIPEEE